jgi:O-antigen ligase
MPGPLRKESPPVHPLERALLVVVALHLVFLPWALGTMHVWSQCVSFGLSIVSFGLAVRPRNYTGEYTEEAPFRLHPLRKLMHFPIFWLGLLLLLYILIQALNPAWEYVTNGSFWWMQGIPCIEWLPTGMRTPFAQASPWHSLMIYSSAWMTVCAIWIGFTRRRCLHGLLVVLVINGTLFALVGVAQKLTGAREILWFLPESVDFFFATIIYKNHAAAFLNLILMAALGLALWHHERASQQLARSDPSFTVLIGALLLFTADLFTNSRMGMILGATGILLGLAAFGISVLQERKLVGGPLPLLLMAMFLAGFLGFGLSRVDWSQISKRFAALWSDDNGTAVESRNLAREATWEMFQDNPVTGWGAGSFRFYFPVYQQRYPEIFNQSYMRNGKKVIGRRLYWEYAHNDYVQCLAEFGLIGSALVAAICGYWLVAFGRQRRWTHPVALGAVGALGLTATHCWVDFQLHNPANLITLGALLTLALSWTAFSRKQGNP